MKNNFQLWPQVFQPAKVLQKLFRATFTLISRQKLSLCLGVCVYVVSASVCVCLVVVVFILFSTALSFAEFIVVGQVQRPKH